MPTDERERLKVTAEIVAAFLARNDTVIAELPGLIKSVHSTITEISSGAPPTASTLPAVPVAKSVTPDFLICLECGAEQKSLKQHLKRHGLSPAAYRAKWALPFNYPMVAPNLSAHRVRLATETGFGLGRNGKPKARRPAK